MIAATSAGPTASERPLVSIVLPVYNEAAVLGQLATRVEAALAEAPCDYELIFVNDGSCDGSGALMDRLAAQNPRIRAVHFSRNFGHQAAVHAAIAHAGGAAIVVMDSDLQDDPAALPTLIDRWLAGYDVVYAIRVDRKEAPIKRALFRGFYRLLNLVSRTPVPNDAGNFGLIDRAVADQILKLRDCDRYYPGLRAWVGFRQIGVLVERAARHDETPRVSFLGLCRLAKTAIFSFSSVPLALFYAISALSLLVFCGCAGFALYHKLGSGLAVPGWASMTMIASFFGMLNALGIGVLGEYVTRIYDQVRQRPQFIVERTAGFNHAQGESHDSHEAMLEWLAEEWNSTDAAVGPPAASNVRGGAAAPAVAITSGAD